MRETLTLRDVIDGLEHQRNDDDEAGVVEQELWSLPERGGSSIGKLCPAARVFLCRRLCRVDLDGSRRSCEPFIEGIEGVYPP